MKMSEPRAAAGRRRMSGVTVALCLTRGGGRDLAAARARGRLSHCEAGPVSGPLASQRATAIHTSGVRPCCGMGERGAADAPRSAPPRPGLALKAPTQWRAGRVRAVPAPPPSPGGADGARTRRPEARGHRAYPAGPGLPAPGAATIWPARQGPAGRGRALVAAGDLTAGPAGLRGEVVVRKPSSGTERAALREWDAGDGGTAMARLRAAGYGEAQRARFLADVAGVTGLGQADVYTDAYLDWRAAGMPPHWRAKGPAGGRLQRGPR